MAAKRSMQSQEKPLPKWNFFAHPHSLNQQIAIGAGILTVVTVVGYLAHGQNITTPQSTFASSYSKAVSRDKERYTQLATLSEALDAYKKETKEYPASLTALAPTYLQEIPKDPSTGQPFGYQGDAGKFTVKFGLEQGTTTLPAGEHTLSEKGFDSPAPTSTEISKTENAATTVTIPTVPAGPVAAPHSASDAVVPLPPQQKKSPTPLVVDSDNDGLSDALEIQIGTDPHSPNILSGTQLAYQNTSPPNTPPSETSPSEPSSTTTTTTTASAPLKSLQKSFGFLNTLAKIVEENFQPLPQKNDAVPNPEIPAEEKTTTAPSHKISAELATAATTININTPEMNQMKTEVVQTTQSPELGQAVKNFWSLLQEKIWQFSKTIILQFITLLRTTWNIVMSLVTAK